MATYWCLSLHAHPPARSSTATSSLGIFSDVAMNIKLGDSGLAALIESPGEGKKIVCGPSNYIAPEV